MFLYCNLAVLMVLTFNGHVKAGRIINGHEAKPHSRPYMVLLEMKNNASTNHCGGFLLSPDFVMTAAHCQAESYEVLLGLHNYYDKQKSRISVKQAFPHEDYCEHTFRNDIMLLKLASKAGCGENVKPITMANQFDCASPKSCIVSGWGRTSNTNPSMSQNLMEVNVTLIHDESCEKDKVFCSMGEMGPAQGDSGGPLVCDDGKAYGVVSVAGSLDSSTMMFRYTKIPNYREWIDEIIKHN